MKHEINNIKNAYKLYKNKCRFYDTYCTAALLVITIIIAVAITSWNIQ